MQLFYIIPECLRARCEGLSIQLKDVLRIQQQRLLSVKQQQYANTLSCGRLSPTRLTEVLCRARYVTDNLVVTTQAQLPGNEPRP